MLRETFIGRRPSHFHINNLVISFIISETFLWSAWNFIAPIFAIFVANNVAGGNIQIASSSFSVYLIARIIFELITGKYLCKANDFKKFIATIIGILFVSLGYLGFALTNSVAQVFLFYAIVGVGIGTSTPSKVSLFSTHLDKNKETMEWGFHDAVVLTGVAFAAALGGFVANQYGFKLLFLISALLNLFAVIPYLLYIHKHKTNNDVPTDTCGVKESC